MGGVAIACLASELRPAPCSQADAERIAWSKAGAEECGLSKNSLNAHHSVGRTAAPCVRAGVRQPARKMSSSWRNMYAEDGVVRRHGMANSSATGLDLQGEQ